mgnify:FL=1
MNNRPSAVDSTQVESSRQAETLVLGGGLAGLITSFYLLEAGKKVLLVEKQQIGKEASWAGGGILSPLKPWTYSQWHDELTSLSKECFEFLKAKLESIGATFEENKTGMLYLDESLNETVHQWFSRHENEVELLEGESLQDFLNKNDVAQSWKSNTDAGIWMPLVSNIRNPRFIAAVKQYLDAHPDFTLMENTEARLVLGGDRQHKNGSRLHGVDLIARNGEKTFLPSREVVVTAGAWSQGILQHLDLPQVKPIRGQMLLFKSEARLPFIIMKGNHYLIPRSDGLILAGSTTENAGFDQEVTQEAFDRLHQFASELMPEFKNAKPIKHWAGLRPAVDGQEGVPLVGPVASIPGLWVNTGHFRNGIVHAPGAAKLLVDAMTGNTPALPITLNAQSSKVTRPDLASLTDNEAI